MNFDNFLRVDFFSSLKKLNNKIDRPRKNASAEENVRVNSEKQKAEKRRIKQFKKQ